MSAGASGREIGGVEEVSMAGGLVASGQGAVAALSPSGGAGFGDGDIFCSIMAMRSSISWRAGSRWPVSTRWRCRRPADLVGLEFAEVVEASESWSDEEPSEAGEVEDKGHGAGAAGVRLRPGGRRVAVGGAEGIAKVVLSCGGGRNWLLVADGDPKKKK